MKSKGFRKPHANLMAIRESDEIKKEKLEEKIKPKKSYQKSH